MSAYALIIIILAGMVNALFLSGSIAGGGKDNVLLSFAEIEKGEVEVKGSRDALSVKRTEKGEAEHGLMVNLDGDMSVYIMKDVEIDPKGKEILFSLKVGGINTCGNDYRPDDALYPFFIQLVFSDGPDGLSWKKWVSQKFKSMWDQKVKTRRNIIYAFGNRLPKESIVTPYPGGAVISIGDDRDCGRLIQVTRDIENDYLLAFGKGMAGNVMRVIVGFEGFSDNRESIPVLVSEISLRKIS